jgi:hypothetical protein
MIKDTLLNQLVDKQTGLFNGGSSMAQRENVLMQIRERQKELRKEGKNEGLE